MAHYLLVNNELNYINFIWLISRFMEEAVIKFIKEHTNGVKMTEMEACLQQSRLRLGYVASKLMQDGKIKKVENKYFPTALINENTEKSESILDNVISSNIK